MGRLQQVLWNLLRNAIKYTPAGGIIWIETADDPTGQLEIRVRDNGIGIDPIDLPRIFDAFVQGDPALSQRNGGLGLGLAISRALVEQHNGTLIAESPGRGKGATFTLTRPTVDEKVDAEAAPAARDAAAAGRPLRILVVEDHPDTRQVLSKLLRLLGHTVIAEANVAAGLKAADSEVIDLLLSDIGLPDGTGYELLRRVREHSTVPAIALTGFGMECDVKKSKEAGFRDHLTKPVDLQQLEMSIQKIMKEAAV
jgi:CheY-like chemotaxis protein